MAAHATVCVWRQRPAHGSHFTPSPCDFWSSDSCHRLASRCFYPLSHLNQGGPKTYLFCLFCFVSDRVYHVTLTGLELTMNIRLASNLESSTYFCLSNSDIEGVPHPAWQNFFCFVCFLFCGDIFLCYNK